jgi:hypothetical protein
MSIAMALYVAEAAFPSLQKVNNHTKAMIDSWSTFVNENKEPSQFFNPHVPAFTQPGMGRNNNMGEVTRDDYIKYAWLFGAR